MMIGGLIMILIIVGNTSGSFGQIVSMSPFIIKSTVAFGLIGLVLGIFGGLVSGGTDMGRVNKTSPNQGIELSLKNAIITLLVVGPIVGMIYELSLWLILWQSEIQASEFQNVSWLSGVLFGLFLSLHRGGSAVLKHYSLRLIFWLNGSTPFRFITFLDHCAKLILLKKVGGGYMFIHQTLLEYFAELNHQATNSRDSAEKAAP